MGFDMVFKLALGAIASVVVLVVYPVVKTLIDASVVEMEWALAPGSFLAFVGMLPIIAIGVIIVATVWWVISG